MSFFQIIQWNTVCIVIGFIIDCIIGDPPRLPHLVRLIGRMISFLEKGLYKKDDSDNKKLCKGIVLAAAVPLISLFGSCLVLLTAAKIHFALYILFDCIFCSQVLAAHDLCAESLRVGDALMGRAVTLPNFETGKMDKIPEAGSEEECLQTGRRAVSMIVGRDVERLDKKGVIKAAVETVAENTSDGVIAPLFYLLLGGPALAICYKAVNTLDSMVAYKNEKYLYFGRASAYQDDIWNYVPARLSALLMCAAAFCLKYDFRRAFRVWRRDGRKHESPNSAQTESACAGALSLQLAGDTWYFGKCKHKPSIGDPVREIETNDIKRACRLMYGTTVLMLLFLVWMRMIVCFLYIL